MRETAVMVLSRGFQCPWPSSLVQNLMDSRQNSVGMLNQHATVPLQKELAIARVKCSAMAIEESRFPRL